MKPNILDRFIGFFSPEAGAKRIATRKASDLILRSYDAAQTNSTSDWISAQKSSQNSENQAALPVLRDKSRSLVRNNAYSVRALNTIVSNTVGAGIELNIKGRTKTQVKKLTDEWKRVAESSLCDTEGKHNFCALQVLAMRSLVESGEILALTRITENGAQIKMLESDFLFFNTNTQDLIQGVRVDPDNKAVSYVLYKKHPGDLFTNAETIEIPADQVIHVFRQERPGQVRGVPWAAPVIERLKDLDDYQDATLISKKVAACFTAFIKTNDNSSLISAEALKAKRENELQLSPATVRYLGPNEDITLASPPAVEGYSDFTRETLRAIAAGFGISYEALTGDYSQVNFSSGRMGHIEMRRNIDNWRWNVLIPQFCEKYFQLFLFNCKILGFDVEGVTAEWVPPSHTMIDPVKETEALRAEVRSGFKTYGQAVREQGLDPDEVVEEIQSWNQKFDDSKIILDIDPRNINGTGAKQVTASATPSTPPTPKIQLQMSKENLKKNA